MVQVYKKQDREAIFILIPEIKEKAEKIEKKKEQDKRKLKIRKHIKQHQKRVKIGKIGSKIDACKYQVKIYNR